MTTTKVPKPPEFPTNRFSLGESGNRSTKLESQPSHWRDSLDICRVIQQRMCDLGLQVKDLATAAGVSDSQIYALLSGVRTVSGQTDLYEKLSQLLQFPPGYLSGVASTRRDEKAGNAADDFFRRSAPRSVAPMQMYAEAGQIERQLQASSHIAAIERWKKSKGDLNEQ